MTSSSGGACNPQSTTSDNTQNSKTNFSIINVSISSPMAISEIVGQALNLKKTLISTLNHRYDSIRTESIIFTLHSTLTVAIFIFGTIFVTMKQYFGEPIECFGGKSPDISQTTLQHYCWMEGVFTVSTQIDDFRDYPGRDSAYIGVKPYYPHLGDRKIHHKYYQWVYYVLWIQSILFYAPKYLWKAREDRRLRNIISTLRNHHILEIDPLPRQKLVQEVADIISVSNDFFYFVLFCEIYFLVHLILQIWFTNMFLGGSFLTLGIEWLQYSNLHKDPRNDPLIRVFPRLAKCNFHKYGFSGSVETFDALCFMSLNIVNEKVYVLLWFWYVFLFIVTTFYIVFYRTAILLIPYYRFTRLRSIAPTADQRFLRKLVSRSSNWFVLQVIAHHIRPYYFRDLIEVIQKDFFDKDLNPTHIDMTTFAINGVVPSAPKQNHMSSAHNQDTINFNYECNPPVPNRHIDKKKCKNSSKLNSPGFKSSILSGVDNDLPFDDCLKNT